MKRKRNYEASICLTVDVDKNGMSYNGAVSSIVSRVFEPTLSRLRDPP